MNDERMKALLSEPMSAGDPTAKQERALNINEPSAWMPQTLTASNLGEDLAPLSSDPADLQSRMDEAVRQAVLGEDQAWAINECQSLEMGDDRRTRDRSGNKPKKRKWLDRAKAKAARKARRINR